MAASRKVGGNGKNRAGSKNTGRKTVGRTAARQEEDLDQKLLQEISLIVVFAVCIFLFLCNFGIIGSVGGFISSVQFGLFGLPAYVTSILFFFALAFGMINRGSGVAKRKLISGVVLYFLISMVCEMATGRLASMDGYSLVFLYREAAENHNGGGALAGSFAYLSYHYLSMAGTVLLIIVAALICIVLLTEKSVIGGAKKSGRFLAEGAKRLEEAGFSAEEAQDEEEEDVSFAKRWERRRQEKQERARLKKSEQERRAEIRRGEQEERLRKKRQEEEEREDKKILRMNKKSRGVMLDTALTKEEPVEKIRNDMHEIMVQEDIEEDIPGNPAPVEQRMIRREAQDDEVQEISPRAGRDRKAREISVQAGGNGQAWDDVLRPDENPAGREMSPWADNRRKTRESEAVFDMPQDGGAGQDGSGFTESERAAMPEPVTEFTPGRASLASSVRKESPSGGTEHNVTAPKAPPKKYIFPPVTLLKKGKSGGQSDNNKELKDKALRLQQTLETFGVRVTVTEISQGPSVTRFEIQPEQGVKVSKIVGLADDIKLNLAATDVRIEAPIPGKAAVGIEVPNKENMTVAFRDLIESKEYQGFSSKIAFAVGKDIGGQVVVADIAKMPHVLIAGATGSGKSVCINTIIMSILYKAHPDDVKLIMIDPKVVELSVYNGIPHLLLPVVTDPKKASSALHWGVAEMEKRYTKFAEQGVRDLKGYNQKAQEQQRRGVVNDIPALEKMPQIVIIVDELADLMMVAPGEVEESICRLAQLARAAGIHLVIATQRPSVDVITGLIKANMPSRIAFAVSSGVDSRTILDMNGAEKLLGKGDMLFYPQGFPKPARVQGAFISDEEVQDVVDFLKDQQVISSYQPDIEQQMKASEASAGGAVSESGSGYDEYFAEAGRFIIEKDKASIGMLQRVFKIGFNRAARIMDQLCEAGVVGEEEGTKPRKVLMSPEQFEQYISESV